MPGHIPVKPKYDSNSIRTPFGIVAETYEIKKSEAEQATLGRSTYMEKRRAIEPYLTYFPPMSFPFLVPY